MDEREIQEILARLAELMEEVNDAHKQGKEVSRELYDEMERLKTKLKNVTKESNNLSGSFNKLGRTAADLGRSMYRGEQGASAFNDSLGAMGSVLSALVFAIPGLGKAAGAASLAIKGMTTYLQAAAEQGDTLYNSYVDLAKSGAATAGGLEQVFENLQKFGMGIEQLDTFSRMIAENREQLSKFSPTVGEATNQLADISAGIVHTGLRREFMMLGYTVPEINEAMVDYIALQSHVGMTQNRSTRQLTNASGEYLKTVDALTRATGIQRDQMQENIRSARQEQQFRARMNRMRREDPDRSVAIETALAVLAERAPETAKGLRSMTSGVAATDEAMKVQAATGGRALRMVTSMMEGTTDPIAFLQNFAETAGGVSLNFERLAEVGAFDQAYGPFYEYANLGVDAQKNLVKSYNDAIREQKDSSEQQGSILDGQVGMRIAQMEARDALQAMVQSGVAPATTALDGLANITNSVVDLLDTIPGIGRKEAEQASGASFLSGTRVTGRDNADEFSQAGSGVSGSAIGTQPEVHDTKASQVVAGLVSELKGSAGITAQELFASPSDPAGKTAERIVRGLSIGIDDDLSGFGDDTRLISALAQRYLGLVKHDEAAAGGRYKEEVAEAIARELGIDQEKVDSFRKGGISRGPESGYFAELHGTEAIVPLSGGSIPVTISNLQQQMMAALREISGDNPQSNFEGQITTALRQLSGVNIANSISSLESSIATPMQQLAETISSIEDLNAVSDRQTPTPQLINEDTEMIRYSVEQISALKDQITRLDRLIQVTQSNNSIMSKILQNSYA